MRNCIAVPLLYDAFNRLGFPASMSTLLLPKKSERMIMKRPVPTSSHAIFRKSAIGPNMSIPRGIIDVEIIPIIQKPFQEIHLPLFLAVRPFLGC